MVLQDAVIRRPRGRVPVVRINGDGIGPEVMGAVSTILDATGAPIEWIDMPAGLGAFERYGNALPEETVRTIRKARTAIKGPTETPKGEGHVSANILLREELKLDVGVRPIHSLNTPILLRDPIDAVIIRQNRGGYYGSKETRKLVRGKRVVRSVATFDEDSIFRTVKFAFEYAVAHGRKKVTMVTKANILKVSGGLWLEIFYEVAAGYPGIIADDLLVDAVGELFNTHPDWLDVLVLENLFGDIHSDTGAGVIGGLGIASGANVGKRFVLYEATHGTAKNIVGKNLANPLALLFSSIQMLRRLGFLTEADRLDAVVQNAIRAGRVTGDLKKFYPDGTRLLSTSEFVDAIVRDLAAA